jgi:glycine reductase
LPVDVLRELENEGIIGSLHNTYYATVGNGTSVANSRQYARPMPRLKNQNIDRCHTYFHMRYLYSCEQDDKRT